MNYLMKEIYTFYIFPQYQYYYIPLEMLKLSLKQPKLVGGSLLASNTTVWFFQIKTVNVFFHGAYSCAPSLKLLEHCPKNLYQIKICIKYTFHIHSINDVPMCIYDTHTHICTYRQMFIYTWWNSRTPDVLGNLGYANETLHVNKSK